MQLQLFLLCRIAVVHQKVGACFFEINSTCIRSRYTRHGKALCYCIADVSEQACEATDPSSARKLH